MATYQVENQWGGALAPWNTGSTWLLGIRDNQYLVAIDIVSDNGGRTLKGTIKYNGEGPIRLSAKHKCGNMYSVKVQWGSDTEPWHSEGTWIIGGRNVQRCVQLKADVSADGKVLLGTTTYYGEGPIGFRGTYIPSYEVKNQWYDREAPWYKAGIWVLSGRTNQRVTAMDIKTIDKCGYILEGTMTYEGEGPIGFKAVWIVGNNYEVYNQWGGTKAPWHRSGDMIIGATYEQRVVGLKFISKDKGKHLRGYMTYEGEEPIGFKAKLVNQIINNMQDNNIAVSEKNIEKKDLEVEKIKEKKEIQEIKEIIKTPEIDDIPVVETQVNNDTPVVETPVIDNLPVVDEVKEIDVTQKDETE